jgi:hypothetical protein
MQRQFAGEPAACSPLLLPQRTDSTAHESGLRDSGLTCAGRTTDRVHGSGANRTLANYGRPDQSINVLDRLDLRLNDTHILHDNRLSSHPQGNQQFITQ